MLPLAKMALLLNAKLRWLHNLNQSNDFLAESGSINHDRATASPLDGATCHLQIENSATHRVSCIATLPWIALLAL